MVDEGGRKRGDHSEGEDRPEPERQVGGSEWLLQQLSNGRLKSIFDAPRQPAAPAADAPLQEEAPAASDRDESAPSSDGTAEPSATATTLGEADSEPEAPATQEQAAPEQADIETTASESGAPAVGAESAGTGGTYSDDRDPSEGELDASSDRPSDDDSASAAVDAVPVDAETIDTAPADAETTDAAAADTASADAAPVDTASADSAPADVRSEDAATGDAGTADSAEPRDEAPRSPSTAQRVPGAFPLGPVIPETRAAETSSSRAVPPVADPTPDVPAATPPTVTTPESRPTAPPAGPEATPTSTATTRPPLPAGEPPADLPSAPRALRDERPRPEPRGDRPEGATAPAPRDPEPTGAVYHWPDPRGGWDEPPVWEDVVASSGDPDDDGGDEELWRGTAGAYAWNLEPTAAEDAPAGQADAGAPDAADSSDGSEATPPAASPFRTSPATAHVNSAATRAQPSREKKPPRQKTPPREKSTREKTPPPEKKASREKAPREKAPRAAVVPSVTSVGEPPSGRARSRRRLLIALLAVGVVVVLAVIAAIGFAVASGNNSSEGAAAPAPVASETSAAPSATPTPTLPTVGPLPAGTWAWSTLLGGECLQPFDSVWAEEFTVVDCATPHSGEMVATGELTDAAFPGQEALAVSVSSLCQAQGVVDITGAASYGDVQVSGSFPATQEQWDSGERSYYCFVDRSGGGELLGSLVGTPAA